jgi:hypothetical protein
VWRLVMERVATLDEILNRWDLRDVLDAHIALSLMAEAEQSAYESARK